MKFAGSFLFSSNFSKGRFVRDVTGALKFNGRPRGIDHELIAGRSSAGESLAPLRYLLAELVGSQLHGFNVGRTFSTAAMAAAASGLKSGLSGVTSGQKGMETCSACECSISFVVEFRGVRTKLNVASVASWRFVQLNCEKNHSSKVLASTAGSVMGGVMGAVMGAGMGLRFDGDLLRRSRWEADHETGFT